MKTGKKRRLLAFVLAAAMGMTAIPAQAEGTNDLGQAGDQRQADVPKPYYEFTFDQWVSEGKVENEGSKEQATASISGTGQGLGIVEDEVRGNKVLNLPGGGLNQGSLILPDDMFADVTEAGFAFSFWINIDASAIQYSRIFSASPNELNGEGGENGWTAPEFTFVAGDTEAKDLGDGGAGYNTSIMLPDRKSQLKLVWERQFARGAWQHVTVSVSPTEYQVYLDGEKVNITYDRNKNQSTILQALFADNAAVLKGFTHNAIGRSVYNSDHDLKAKMDEFRFYNTSLTAEQAKAAYDSYAVRDSVVEQLRQKVGQAQAKSASFYTKESYDLLAKAIADGLAGVENPVTEANVNRLKDQLDAAILGLEFYPGVTEDTRFFTGQLEKESKAAKTMLSQGVLSAESENKVRQALAKAEQALAGQDQQAVDAALLSLREAVGTVSYGATLHFDADPAKRGTDLFHGSTGFLYGVSEVNVPSSDMIRAIAPKILVQKAADGQQHPSGDGYRLTPFLKDCGVENIQIYLQDYYLEWPYEFDASNHDSSILDYKAKVEKIVKKMIQGKTQEDIAGYSFVLFNEPDWIWYGDHDWTRFCQDWQLIYRAVKAINPAVKVAGPNFSVYDSGAYRTFFEFCQKNECLPEYITWHELQKDKLASFQSHCDQVKGFVETYYADSGITPTIFVNETVNFDDVGNPGALVNWLSIFDEEDVYASLPYWGLANSMNELAADANKPNGAWWVYKWYAQMTGKKTPLTLENIEGPGAYGRLYGLTSVDEEAKTLYSLFGGQAGKQTVSIENITALPMFAGADMAYVKLYGSKYTGHQGFADENLVEFEGNLAFTGDDLVITVPDAELMDAYFAIIMPATGGQASTIAEYQKNWRQTYEAEDAALIGGAKAFTKAEGGDLARSNRAEVGGMNSESDGVKFTVDVPKTGRYRLNIYYSSQAPQVNPQTLEYVEADGQNRAIGALSRHSLTIDGGAPQEIVYDSTVKWGYYNYKTVYVELTAGQHEIQLMYKGESQNGKNVDSMLCALLDKIDLAWALQEEAKIQIEPEELAGSQEGFALSQEGSFSGAGSAAGSGRFEFYVNAPRDGYYTVETKGSGTAVLSKSRVNYGIDAAAESEVWTDWMKLFDVALGNQAAGKVYLTAGVNRLSLEGNNLVLDLLTFTEDTQASGDHAIVTEAENCQLSGTDPADGYQYLPGSAAAPAVIETAYASGQKAVEGFRGGKNHSLTLKVSAPQAGDYKLSVVYSNNEPAPVMKKQNGDNYVHPYNTDLVERYMQISVNGGVPQTVYFKNTFCWDTYKNTIVDVRLSKGENVIVFSNDNSYKFSSVQDDFSPRLDKFVIAPAMILASQTGTDPGEDPGQKPGTGTNPGEDPGQKPGTGTNPGGDPGQKPGSQKAANKITGIASSIKKTYGKKSFTLKAKGQGAITYFSSDKKVVTVGKTNGKVSIKGCGKAVITVQAAGNAAYQPGTKKVTVTIAPKKQTISSIKSASSKTIFVKWKKDTKADGYQIQYSLSKKFKGAKTVNVKKNRIASVKIKKGLKASKCYYVRVRSYKKSGKAKIWGSYSKAKKVTVKK